MRLSVFRDDPGYSPLAVPAKVFVDGVEVSQCFTADEDEGVAYCYATDDAGNLIFNLAGDDLAVVERRGNVKIVVPSSWESDIA